MSLKVLQPGIQPLGQFDGLDSEFTSVKGGEVVGFTYVSSTGTDKKAKDVDDGYVSASSKTRPAVTKTLVSGMRPLFLCDDGTTGYGTLFGTVVGGTAGSAVSGGSALGPHTATGSGKVTLWDKSGLYAVSLDACDTTASTGLAPTNTTLAGGAALYATAAGLLTPNAGSAFEALVVGRFIEFTTNGSLVNTPVDLVQALNSPSGGGVALKPFTHAVFRFDVEN
jgi:hypothetical protein